MNNELHPSCRFSAFEKESSLFPVSVPRAGCGLLLVLMVFGACGSDSPSAMVSPDGGSSHGASGSGGLPCDVAQVFQTHCQQCHGSPPMGAPMSLVGYHDLTTMSPAYPKQTIAQRTVARMQDALNPMPPGTAPTVPASEVARVQSWISSGMPMGTIACGGGNMPTQCSSGQYWMGGDQKSPDMHPGNACIACHTTTGSGAPTLQIAGTIYQTPHDPNDCLGIGTAGVVVQITDSAGSVFSLPVNSSGNFLLQTGKLKPPYHALVSAGGKTRAMSVAQTSGDCNSCHTPTGAHGAPGRILAP